MNCAYSKRCNDRTVRSIKEMHDMILLLMLVGTSETDGRDLMNTTSRVRHAWQPPATAAPLQKKVHTCGIIISSRSVSTSVQDHQLMRQGKLVVNHHPCTIRLTECLEMGNMLLPSSFKPLAMGQRCFHLEVISVPHSLICTCQGRCRQDVGLGWVGLFNLIAV